MDSQTTTVELHGMAHGGEAVGRLEDGRAVFVAGGIPGETVEIRITREKKRWARAEVVSVIEASPDRVEPPCPFVGDCGGCQWQHIEVGRQRELKRDIILGQLAHLAGLEDVSVSETVGVGEPDGFGYRNHVHLAVDDTGMTGYYRAGTREVVPVDSCRLLHPLLREWQEQLPPLPGAKRLELRAGTRTFQRLALLRGYVDEDAGEESYQRGIPLGRAGEGEIIEMVGTERFRISSKSFFQVNTDGAERLVQLALETLELSDEVSVVDAFAGVGLFSIPMARVARKVWAVERHPAAVRDLRFHVREFKDTVHVVGTEMQDAFTQLPSSVDRVLADPPREGLGEDVARGLMALSPSKIVLVACDPASLARDAKSFLDGGYSLKQVVPVDLFPHTYHIEAVAEFVRSG
jgi:23S rRNA (uracil1939-C5)-methyltransferase